MSDCRKCAKFEECAVDEDCGLFVDKPMTNADRIRQMGDEELAEWVTLMVCKYRSCGNCPMSDWCTPGRGIEEWLKAPADREDEG